MKDLKAVAKSFDKEHVERMYKIGYYLDRSFLKPTDVVDLGLDLYRLKEFGEVHIKKSWAKIRPLVDGIWARMTDPMKAMFYWSYFCEWLDDGRALLKNMEPFVKTVALEKSTLKSLSVSMSMKLPPELQAKIKEGFGREWGTE